MEHTQTASGKYIGNWKDGQELAFTDDLGDALIEYARLQKQAVDYLYGSQVLRTFFRIDTPEPLMFGVSGK